MRPVHYVPETKKVDELLRELQKGGCTWPSWWTNTAARRGS